ncbi:hypothetical protein M413DRAFT_443976 [Hebeloma cylindrosporum]|uniref:Pop1 N-terminal domain-containing protein n=1 Tax=Hebeloma cylindrosporum TaxID=76867 RepID=A0A0C3CG90_HEBCY|nr:hypothetical protein M413DRAFT_443976 [Hebeloma cylindrosporum h7]
MALKRRNGEAGDEMTGREKKKLKVSNARTIAVQPSAMTSNAVAGPSSSKAKDSLIGLPAALDVEHFIEARAFEIDAMHKAMKTASASSSYRVWQTLPRHLRRRAASHDVRRVPLRLRDRARAEMDPIRKKALGRAMPRGAKNRRIDPTASFLKRQRNKTWLETHLWHAKRMHMENIWGYRLAISPTEKSYRPSHRASVRGSILHDASYYSCVEIRGPEKIIIIMLELCCDPQAAGPGSKRCLTGSRTLETCIYRPGSYPYDLVAPLTIIWKPHTQRTSKERETQTSRQSLPSKNKGKAKAGSDPPSKQLDSMVARSVWLRFHPSAHTEVLDTLREAASQTLANRKASQDNAEEVNLEISDLKGHLNAFEIMGPKASQVIKGALSPVRSEQRGEFQQFWSSLTNLQSAGSIPRGMIIGFKVNDPRLKFPPKNAKATHCPNPIPPTTLIFPSSHLAECEIWDDTVRNGLAKPRFKKKDLDERRAKSEIPGMPLNSTRLDDTIPVLLIQRSVETSKSTDSQALHGWTLIVPAGWSMAFFSSLVFTNTRVAGQLERQTQAYEAGTAYFPRDYPFTQPYQSYALDRERQEKGVWERKPPAKRVNYDKLAIENPWRPVWETVLGIPEIREETTEGEVKFVSTQRETLQSTSSTVRPWLFRGFDVPNIVAKMSSVFNHGAVLLSEINRLRVKRGHSPFPSSFKAADILQGALITVKITMCSRGSPKDLAILHSLSDDVYGKWEKILSIRRSAGVAHGQEIPEETELTDTVPCQTSAIGYVTTGHYSLTRGHGFAIGAIPVVHFLELDQQVTRLHPNQKARLQSAPILVGVRNTDGHQYRGPVIELLES